MNFTKILANVPLPLGSNWFLSIERIPSFGKDLFDSRSRLDVSRAFFSPNDKEVESARRANASSLVSHPQCRLRAPKEGVFIFNVDTVIKEADKNVA